MANSSFKKNGYGGYYIITPDGDRVDIDKSVDRKGEWTGGGSYYEKLSDAKADILQRIKMGEGFNVGGIAMKKQMELFDDGGLKDEGGTTDPVSGNDVPVGSTQEEVRDDIPAQLSEGEFVLPADVVRYHGLEKIMELRDEAKAGLAKMEAMGQMGNSEEATLPDDVPFSVDDLELEDDGVGFQVGGFVPSQGPGQGFPSIPPGIPTPSGNFGINTQQAGPVQSQFTNYQPPFIPTIPNPNLPTYQAPQQQFTPIAQQTTTPNFSSFVVPKTAIYVDKDGNKINIPVDENGNPLIPIPPGYSKQGAKKDTPEEAAAPTTTTTQETAPQPSDDSSPSTDDSGFTMSKNDADVAAFNLVEKAQGFTGPSFGSVVEGIQAENKSSLLGGVVGNVVGAFKTQKQIGDAKKNQIENLSSMIGLSVEDTKNVMDTFSDEIRSGYRDPVTGEVSGQKDLRTGAEKIKDLATGAFDKVTGRQPADRDEFGNIASDGSMPVTDVTRTAVTDITDMSPEAMQRAADELQTGVQSARVTEPSISAVDAARIDREERGEFDPEGIDDKPEITSEIAGRTTIPADSATTTRTRPSTPVAADETVGLTSDSPFNIEEFERDVRRDRTTARDRVDAGEFADRRTTRSAAVKRAIPTMTASERADEEAAESEGGAAFDSSRLNTKSRREQAQSDSNYNPYDDKTVDYTSSTGRSFNVSGIATDDKPGQGTTFASGFLTTDSTGKVTGAAIPGSQEYNERSSDDGGGSDPCIIATHGVSTGGFSLLDKAKAELWCEKTYHGKWYGEAFRRGYRYYANRAVQKGVAQEYYTEFKNFVACGRGLRKDIKSKINYYRRTMQFFVTGLFIK